jgi:uncharacterized membrane protein
MRALVRRSGWGLCTSAIAAALLAACGGDDGEPGDGSAGSGGTSGATGTVTWCQVSEVLAAKCQVCHGTERQYSAPFSLVTYEDTQVVDAPGPRYARVKLMVQGDFMPPGPEGTSLPDPPDKLTADQRDLIVTWVDEGAKAVGGTDCSD